MNKQEFMRDLESRLRRLSAEDKNDAIEYYSEYIDDLEKDPNEDICQYIGTPREIANEIIDKATIQRIEKQKEDNNNKGTGKILWLTILGICTSPISVPLAAVLIITIMVILILIAVFLLCIFTVGGALVTAGVAFAIFGILSGNFAQALTMIGEGFLCAGLGLLIILAGIALSKLIIKGIAKFSQKRINKRRIKKEEK